MAVIKQLNKRLQPLIVATFSITRSDEQVLLYERLRPPYIHKFGFPFVRVQIGETLDQAVERAKRDVISFDVELAHRGEYYIIIRDGDMVLNHLLAHVFAGEVGADNLTEHTTKEGKTFWADWLQINYDRFIPGYYEAHQLLERRGHFIETLEFDVGEQASLGET
jgi:ADP-ribose pyrophosphatase YjhB (NUDIX family)